MARMFITGFRPNSQFAIGLTGFYHDVASGAYSGVDIDNIPYDPTLSTTVRQQVLDSMVPYMNQRLIDMNITAAPLIASDIEIVS